MLQLVSYTVCVFPTLVYSFIDGNAMLKEEMCFLYWVKITNRLLTKKLL